MQSLTHNFDARGANYPLMSASTKTQAMNQELFENQRANKLFKLLIKQNLKAAKESICKFTFGSYTTISYPKS